MHRVVFFGPRLSKHLPPDRTGTDLATSSSMHRFYMSNWARFQDHMLVATDTRVTGRNFGSATGAGVDGVTRTWRAGDRCSFAVTCEAPEGGELSGRDEGRIVQIAVGTEAGMFSTTAVAVVECRDGARRVIPCRHLSGALS